MAPLHPDIYAAPPAAALAVLLERARPSMRDLYTSAFSAFDRTRAASNRVVWEITGAPLLAAAPPLRPDELVGDSAWLTMWSSAKLANAIASAILLLADDALSSYARRLGLKPGTTSSFGPRFNDVPFSALLRAATNAIRHASQWADDPALPSPASPRWNDPTIKWSETQMLALESIRPLCKALHLQDRVNDAVSIDVLIVIDGRSRSAEGPNYAQFDAAFLEAARSIARARGPSEVKALDSELASIAPPPEQ